MKIKTRYVPTPKQRLFHECPADEVLYGGAAGGGKILADEGIILTPFGWKKGKDLKVGDLVCNPDGSIQRVIQISPRMTLPKVRVYFSDGTYTDVAWGHLWLAWRGRKGRKYKNKRIFGEASAEVIETRELKEWIDRGYNPQIPINYEVAFNRINKWKIDPYLLGLLLGDGTISENICITTSREDAEEYLTYIQLKNISIRTSKSKPNTVDICFVGEDKKFLIEQLKKMKLYKTRSDTKFIPEAYKWSSVEERYAIIQGLMDADGYTAPDKNACYYTTTSQKLAEDVAFILRSLGAYVSITEKQGKLYGIPKKKIYELYIKHRTPEKLFRLKRKKEIASKFKRKNISKRVIAVEEVGIITGRCITVSNPNGLYITNDFIVTHNSVALVMDAFFYAVKYPRASIVLFRRSYPELQETLIRYALEFYPLEVGRYIANEKVFIFVNGSKILFRYLEKDKDVLRYQGAEFDYIGFDELTHFSQYRFEYMKSRLRSSKGYPTYIRATSNPDPRNPVNTKWVKEYFVDFVSPTIQKPYKLRKDKVGRTRAFIPATVYDNPHLLEKDPGYVKRLESLPELEKQALLYGNWDIKREGLVYENFSQELVKTLKIEPRWYIFAGLDFGATNPTACVFIATDGKIFYAFDEIYTPNITLDALAQEIKKRRPSVVYYDPSGKGFARELTLRGVNCQPAENDLLSGIFYIRQLIADKCLFVSPKCENLIQEFGLYSWEEGKDKPVKAFDHALDALRYALFTFKHKFHGVYAKSTEVSRQSTQIISDLRRFYRGY